MLNQPSRNLGTNVVARAGPGQLDVRTPYALSSINVSQFPLITLPQRLTAADYSQCQPPIISGNNPPRSTPTSSATKAPSSSAPVFPSSRTRRTFPGFNNPTRAATSTKPAAPVPTVAQLYDQCGGQTFTGATRCVEGLKCVKVDDFYSQCQKA